MKLSELYEAVDRLRISGLDTTDSDVLLYDLATDELIIVDSIELDGDNNLIIKFDYSD